MKLPNRAMIHWIFVGPDGIRVGWSVLLFILLLAVPSVPIRLAVVHFHLLPKGEIPPGLGLVAETLNLATVFFATAIMARIEKRRFWLYGLASKRPSLHFLIGCAGGLASLSLVICALFSGGYLVFDGLGLHGLPIVGYGLVWLLGFFLVGVSEEWLFRGYLQYTLARAIGFWPAALVLSLVFAAGHLTNNGENALGIAQVVAAGLVFCLLLRTSGSLWLAIGFHTTWDWAQSYLYGTPDSGLVMRGHLLITHAAGNPRFSGGTAGPEGSAFAMPLLLLGPLVLVFLYRRAGLFPTAQTSGQGSLEGVVPPLTI
jgi:membrane protease YdiL (CAAX protease family)